MKIIYKITSLTLGALLLIGSHLFGQTFASGQVTEATGIASTAMGHSTTASGNYSTAMGFNTTAFGNYSTAMGYGATASVHYSTAMGYYTTASGFASTAIGTYNTGYTPTGGDTDRIFVIGNGAFRIIQMPYTCNEMASCISVTRVMM